jgi:hydrogenase maturation protease
VSDRVLIAGIGNIFLGDDAFGVEVVRPLLAQPMPERVDVVDYGIRGVHLAYDLLDGRYGVLVLVDALPMAEPPGTVAVLEVDLNDPQWTKRDGELGGDAPDGHGLDPQSCLRLVAQLGVRLDRVVVVGCQPGALAEEMALTPAVRAALEPTRDLVVRIAGEEAMRMQHTGRVEAGA